VLFLGQSNEIDKILCFSDLFLLPSEKESFGLAALEAMINGVPVISTNTGGLPEVNKQGISGYLSDVGAVSEMATNAKSILKDEENLKKFKRNAREQARTFDIEKVVPQYERLYMQTLQTK
jgi:glycosyltransferase involved in cell wall biosynthesis